MKKIIYLLVIVLVLASAVGFLLYNFLQKTPAVNNQNIAPINQSVENENQNSNVNENIVDSYPADDKLVGRAVDERDPKYCDQTTVMKKDDCLYAVAVYVGVEICEQISDATIKTKCLQYHAAITSLLGKDLKGCLALSDQEFRSSCLIQLYIQQNDLAYCEDLPVNDKILCEDLINKNLAIKAADNKICAKIQDKGIESDCNSAIKNLPLDQDNDGISDDLEKSFGTDSFKADTDSDGLSDYDEIYIYHTNPTKADTDGDGFSDGEEVKNGYNPLGK